MYKEKYTTHEKPKTKNTYKAVYLKKGTKGAPALRTRDGGLKILLPLVNSPHTPSPPHGHMCKWEFWGEESHGAKERGLTNGY